MYLPVSLTRPKPSFDIENLNLKNPFLTIPIDGDDAPHACHDALSDNALRVIITHLRVIIT